MILQQLKDNWVDEAAYHSTVKDLFTQQVNEDTELYNHRKWVRDHVFGMGEDAFHWFWKILVDELPDSFSFLEIGVHKGQVISLIRLLSNRTQKEAKIYGITPMDGAGTGWTEDDYEGDIKRLHDEFKLQQPRLYKGLSRYHTAGLYAHSHHPFNVLYVDGDHSYVGAKFDLDTYAPMIVSGGWLVVDDAACSTHQNFGEFQGIQPVCEALADFLKTETGQQFDFFFNVVHLMIYRRK